MRTSIVFTFAIIALFAVSFVAAAPCTNPVPCNYGTQCNQYTNPYSYDTYQNSRDVSQLDLPVYSVYDPAKQQNVQISSYSYDQLTRVMSQPDFNQFNDVSKVCGSMQLMFGQTNEYCIGVNSNTIAFAQNPTYQSMPTYNYAPQVYVPNPRVYQVYSPGTARAYVSLNILPQPRPFLYPVPQVLYVDPVYPPWAPTYNPYW